MIYLIDYERTELDFVNAAAFVCMRSHKRSDQSDYNPEPQFFISSASSTQLIMETIDNRWEIESGLHWWKDVILNEDECIFMDKNCIQVMATFNNIVYALYRVASAIFDNGVMKYTRIRYKDHPERMLSKMVPLMEKQNLTMLLKENMRGIKKIKA